MPSPSPREVLALCREREIRAVDLRFMDFPGTQKHFTIPVTALTEKSFEDGFGFDGSSMRGWQAINESDMLVVPDSGTAFVDPFMSQTLVMTCNILDPITRDRIGDDVRAKDLHVRLVRALPRVADDLGTWIAERNFALHIVLGPDVPGGDISADQAKENHAQY